jgi:protein-tyrosine kinase
MRLRHQRDAGWKPVRCTQQRSTRTRPLWVSNYNPVCYFSFVAKNTLVGVPQLGTPGYRPENSHGFATDRFAEPTPSDPREGTLTGREFSELFVSKGLTKLSRGEVISLLHRVDVAMGKRSGRSVLFLGANDQAGTSSVAYAYAQLSAQTSDRRVLIIDVREPAEGQWAPTLSVTESFARGRRFDETAKLLGRGLYHNFLVSPGMQPSTAALIRNPEFWQQLTKEFDEVVLDCPSDTDSQSGLVISSHVDGVILVVEAEKTHKLVTRRIVADLRLSHATIVGTVLNKRQYYIPKWLYRHL